MNPTPKPQRRAPKAKKPLRRKGYIERKSELRRTWMKRSAAKPRKGSDPARLRFVRNLPCALGSMGLCYGRVHAHHAGPRPGAGLKASDDTAIPLCAKHHEEWHGASGFFRRFGKDLRRAWSDKVIEATRARWAGTQTQGESR